MRLIATLLKNGSVAIGTEQDDGRIVTDRVTSRKQAESLAADVTIPVRAVDRLTARRVLLRLLTRRPNVVVTYTQVRAELGTDIGHAAVSNAAMKLRRDMNVESLIGAGGGYVLLAAVPAPGKDSCRNCANRTHYYWCKRLHMDVGPGEWCWGHGR
jgi:hypothetical protein